MPISDEKLQRLLELKNKPKPRRGGGRRKGGVDTSIRTYETWFKLRTHMYGVDGEKIHCSNPDCVDPRSSGVQMVAEINGEYMCRYCFLEGYHNTDPAQEELTNSGEADAA